ncbi:Protein of unknown function [Lactobacillus equicursoris 66c]|uniref:Uncharacterized protein n=1 Tax=Lactobacillus equicursoris 66c TaxID=872326 RepID=K0NRL0_9LACO|nr:Protein of unknown function [Lactobacillus equicursoris 66c]
MLYGQSYLVVGYATNLASSKSTWCNSPVKNNLSYYLNNFFGSRLRSWAFLVGEIQAPKVVFDIVPSFAIIKELKKCQFSSVGRASPS